MRTESLGTVTDRNGPKTDDLEAFTSYEDADGLVVCEKTNPRAWICSDETMPLAP